MTGALSARVVRGYPYLLAGSLCFGLAAANATRSAGIGVAVVAAALALAGAMADELLVRIGVLAVALWLAGWWWGSARLDAVDASVLASHLGESEPSLAVVTGPSRRGAFALRVPAKLARFGPLTANEPVMLELSPARAPPQGAVLSLVVRLQRPRPASDGFDERTWLRRHGVHVVAVAREWQVVGHRGGIGGYADRVRGWLAGSLAPGLAGERRAVLEGIVLGEDEGLSPELRDRFRASGLYHLLAVSGSNVVFVAVAVVGLAWLLGVPRWLGELGALAAIASYVLAVGSQPSVIRAGIAGALGSLAWLSARQRDRWHFLVVGAIALLAWSPYNLLDAGFQLSFVAVAAIFVAVPRAKRFFAGYPLPRGLPEVLAVSLACGAATAPILWFQFGRIPVYTVPANALAAPVVGPLLGLSFAAALVAPVSPGAAWLIAWVNGWLAAYLAGCARVVGGLPGATVSSGAGAAALLLLAVTAAALAYRRRMRP
ncbi:MAG TPA: ComEC/Rec2 family competence protein [Gaiellaceae bacterium]|nr:ComEC/Rec2 family competence protein [Gaiellaceae bacterium]